MGDAPSSCEIVKGTCYVLFAHDVAPSIDLGVLERGSPAAEKHPAYQSRRRAPAYFQYDPAPVRVARDASPIRVGQFRTAPSIDLVSYDFGAVSVSYAIPLTGPLDSLIALSDELYDNTVLIQYARRAVTEFLAATPDAFPKTRVSDLVEEYVIFQLDEVTPAIEPERLVAEHGQTLAQVLRSETRPLSEQELGDATEARVSIGRDDLAIVDWNTTLLIGPVSEDVRGVIEFANVQLLELRFLDRLLDDTLERSYELLARPRWWSRLSILRSYHKDLRRVAQLQVDSTVLFERVTNALKLLGEQSVSRTYRLVAERFYLEEWDASVTRKLKAAEDLYRTIADWAASRRFELLEWIIILLIAVSIVIPFVVGK